MNIVKNIIIHHSLVSYNKNADQFDAINEYHKRKWNGKTKSSLGFYGGYHYQISKLGDVKRYRKENETGAHCSQKLMNYRSIGICLDGNFDIEEPTQEQCRSLYKLIKELQDIYGVPDGNVYPHRHFATYKSCWGSLLPHDILGYLDLRLTKKPQVSDWALEAVDAAKKAGITNWDNPQELVNNNTLYHIFHKLGKKSQNDTETMTKEELITILHREGWMDTGK